MNTTEHIDEILRKGLENFHPTPPADVWANLEQSIGNAPAGSNGAGLGKAAKVLKAIKSASILSKVALVAAIPAIATVVYFANPEPKQLPVTPTVQQHDQGLVSKELPKTETLPVEPIVKEKPNKIVAKFIQKAKASEKEVKAASTVPAALVSNQTINAEPKVSGNQESVSTSNPVQKNGGSVQKVANKTQAEPKLKKEDPLITPAKIEQSENQNPEPKVELTIPNVFSPNGDGFNDKFVIELDNPVFFHILIFDKTGKMVYESTQFNQYWNGTNLKTGVDCEEGNYTYNLEFQYTNFQKVQVKRGHINLLR